MLCPECGRDFEKRKLNKHCKSAHRIYYGLSKETYTRIIHSLSEESKRKEYLACPDCGMLYRSLRDLGNHFALSHANDIDRILKKRRRKRPRTKSGLCKNLLAREKKKSLTSDEIARRLKIKRVGFHEGAKVPGSNVRKVDR